ncbi:hypothetical protein DYB38_002687 [Aphanomyces astaci]|uniref:WRKY transcription factor 19 n=1 Tax=Aphanomyces astaci TaxID=112090 RepID=A0A397CUG1_APHAT|nr:hypothetical protein DYB38_002687 [Aphanomyces astaci]
MLTIPSPTCFFANCTHPAVPGSSKCSLHKHRTKCVVDQCANQVYARNLCVRHGGKKKCTYDECQLNARIGEYCSKHGGKSSKAICTHDGCTKQAHKRKKCVRHGGGRKCNVDGCDVHARRGGYCARHGRQATTSGDGRLTSWIPCTLTSNEPVQKDLSPADLAHSVSSLNLSPAHVDVLVQDQIKAAVAWHAPLGVPAYHSFDWRLDMEVHTFLLHLVTPTHASFAPS